MFSMVSLKKLYLGSGANVIIKKCNWAFVSTVLFNRLFVLDFYVIVPSTTVSFQLDLWIVKLGLEFEIRNLCLTSYVYVYEPVFPSY